jgi:prefoldin subunit 5
MATNHLSTANKYIDKQIVKLRAEQTKLLNKADELTNHAHVIEDQIKALYETQDKLLTPEQRASQLELT